MSGILDCFKKLLHPFPPPAPAVVIPIKPIDTVSPVPLKPSGKRTLGIDVSHYEPELTWPQAKADGVEWMYTKATEGLTHVDAYLHKHADAAMKAGVYAGAYHFFHASQDGEKQAANFLASVSGMNLTLPHCLDWEQSSADGMSAGAQIQEALKWLNMVENVTKRPPVIYGGESFLRELKLPQVFSRYPLWLAHYGVPEQRLVIPTPWPRYTMWQYTDSESVSGLASGRHVDANWFNGSVDELKAFAKG